MASLTNRAIPQHLVASERPYRSERHTGPPEPMTGQGRYLADRPSLRGHVRYHHHLRHLHHPRP